MSHPILPRVAPLHNRPEQKCHTLFSQGSPRLTIVGIKNGNTYYHKCHTLFSQGSPLCTIGGTKNGTPYSPKGPPLHNRRDKKWHTLFSQGSPLCTIGG